MSELEHFCDWHIEPSDKPEELYCAAHLAEGLCLKCPYTLENIQYGPRFKSEKPVLYISHSKDPFVGACADFDPVSNLQELIEIDESPKIISVNDPSKGRITRTSLTKRTKPRKHR